MVTPIRNARRALVAVLSASLVAGLLAWTGCSSGDLSTGASQGYVYVPAGGVAGARAGTMPPVVSPFATAPEHMEPLVGAQVTFGLLHRTARTDAQGHYSFRALTAGLWRLRFEHTRIRTTEVDVEVVGGRDGDGLLVPGAGVSDPLFRRLAGLWRMDTTISGSPARGPMCVDRLGRLVGCLYTLGSGWSYVDGTLDETGALELTFAGAVAGTGAGALAVAGGSGGLTGTSGGQALASTWTLVRQAAD